MRFVRSPLLSPLPSPPLSPPLSLPPRPVPPRSAFAGSDGLVAHNPATQPSLVSLLVDGPPPRGALSSPAGFSPMGGGGGVARPAGSSAARTAALAHPLPPPGLEPFVSSFVTPHRGRPDSSARPGGGGLSGGNSVTPSGEQMRKRGKKGGEGKWRQNPHSPSTPTSLPGKGPRRPGQGVEDEQQGVVSAQVTQSG
jgi:hypothetical protein